MGNFIKKGTEFRLNPRECSFGYSGRCLYPSKPHEVGLKFLREVLDKREQHTIPTSEPISMAYFVLKNNYFEFNGQIQQSISSTAIGTKFAPP